MYVQLGFTIAAAGVNANYLWISYPNNKCPVNSSKKSKGIKEGQQGVITFSTFGFKEVDLQCLAGVMS